MEVPMNDEQPPVWRAADDCFVCFRYFTCIRRRHHCRFCGESACGVCSNFKLPLPRMYESHKPQRVCSRCYYCWTNRGWRTPRRSPGHAPAALEECAESPTSGHPPTAQATSSTAPLRAPASSSGPTAATTAEGGVAGSVFFVSCHEASLANASTCAPQSTVVAAEDGGRQVAQPVGRAAARRAPRGAEPIRRHTCGGCDLPWELRPRQRALLRGAELGENARLHPRRRRTPALQTGQRQHHHAAGGSPFETEIEAAHDPCDLSVMTSGSSPRHGKHGAASGHSQHRSLLEALNLRRRSINGSASNSPSREADRALCIVCLDRPAGYAVVPCGHLCLCGACSARCTAQHRAGGGRRLVCPLCRELGRPLKVFGLPTSF